MPRSLLLYADSLEDGFFPLLLFLTVITLNHPGQHHSKKSSRKTKAMLESSVSDEADSNNADTIQYILGSMRKSTHMARSFVGLVSLNVFEIIF